MANFWELKDQITLLKAVNILNVKGIKNLHLKFVGSGKTLKNVLNMLRRIILTVSS